MTEKRLTKEQLHEIYGRWIKPSFYYNMKDIGYEMEDLLKDFKWIGGDGDNNRTDFSKHSREIITTGRRRYERHFQQYIGKEDLPPKETHCICGIAIVENCWIAKFTRDSDGDINECEFPLPPVIGNECIRNFMPESTIWYCVKCGVDMGQAVGYDKCKKCRCTKPVCKKGGCKNKKFGKSDLCELHKKLWCWDCYDTRVYGSNNIRCSTCLEKRKPPKKKKKYYGFNLQEYFSNK
tara:strand:- start:18 stop:725 length:708 start_codon:yes stop_codon:yes gene_type:complete